MGLSLNTIRISAALTSESRRQIHSCCRWDRFDCSAAARRSHIFTCLPNKQCKCDPLPQETVSVVTHNHCPAPQQWSWNCCYVSLERVSMLSLIFAFQNPVATPLSIHSLIPGVTCHAQLIRLERWPVCFKGVCCLSLPHTRPPAACIVSALLVMRWTNKQKQWAQCLLLLFTTHESFLGCSSRLG